MIVLTMEDQENLIDNDTDPLDPFIGFIGFRGYYFKKSYDIVSDESSEHGDVELEGWEVRESSIFYCLESLLKHPAAMENWIEWSSSHPKPGDWLNSEPHQSMNDGKYTSYSLFIERGDGLPLDIAEMLYIGKKTGAHGTENISKYNSM
jgi:hypothetical protein